jgi:prepilin-type N-terminal cleavage/methylation domain-containing protein
MSRQSAARGAGFTLVELLVALALSTCLLAAGWTWMWATRAALTRRLVACEQDTSMAFARRSLRRDVRSAVAVISTAAARSGAHTLVLACTTADGHAGSDVTDYVWDDSRGVLWRRAPGSHVADGVEVFEVRYYDARGAELVPDMRGDLAASAAAAVRRVGVRLVVRAGSVVCEREWQMCLGGGW